MTSVLAHLYRLPIFILPSKCSCGTMCAEHNSDFTCSKKVFLPDEQASNDTIVLVTIQHLQMRSVAVGYELKLNKYLCSPDGLPG